MFPDSKIKSKIELDRIKFDLAPCFQKQCFDALHAEFSLNAQKLSLWLDESFNRISSKKQMDYI